MLKQLHCVAMGERLPLEESEQYASGVGKLLYPANKTRPDLSTSVGRLTRYMATPGQPQKKAAKRVCRYLRSTQDYVLVYQCGPIKDVRRALVAFSDADDFASDPDDRKSTTGYAIFLGTTYLVAWMSTANKAEYMALATTTQMVLHLQGLPEELSFGQVGATTYSVCGQHFRNGYCRWCHQAQQQSFYWSPEFQRMAAQLGLKYMADAEP
jgi:hypothetical protein